MRPLSRIPFYILALALAGAISIHARQSQTPQGPAPAKQDPQETVTVEDANRTFLVHLPRGYDPKTKYPVVLVLHDADNDALDMIRLSGFDQTADEHGVIAVYPHRRDCAAGGRISKPNRSRRIAADTVVTAAVAEEWVAAVAWADLEAVRAVAAIEALEGNPRMSWRFLTRYWISSRPNIPLTTIAFTPRDFLTADSWIFSWVAILRIASRQLRLSARSWPNRKPNSARIGRIVRFLC